MLLSDIELKKLEILDREARVKERELEYNIAQAKNNSWKSPLVVAILAAAIGAMGNAFIIYYSSYLERAAAATAHQREIKLAESAAERERILEMIKIGEPEQVQRNLEFLIDTELVQDSETVASIQEYYQNITPGEGPGASSGTVSFDELGINRSEINGSLKAPSRMFLKENLGKPREELSDSCEPVTNEALKAKLQVGEVGDLRVHLLAPAIQSLEKVFSEIEEKHPHILFKIGSAGTLCVRRVRGSSSTAGSHSWGTAIDLYLDGELDRFGDEKVDVQLYRVALVYIKNGWVWGGGFAGEDSMHFEVSEQLLQRWISDGVL